MLISEEEKKRILNLHQEVIKEEPEKDTYWVISKAERQDLINMGGTAKEIARGAVSYDGFNPDK